MDAHPLFPIESDEDDAPEVGWIHVTRFEGGRQVWATHVFSAEELQSLEDVAVKYGGGAYELIARSRDKGRITARRRYVIAGPPIAIDGTLSTGTAAAGEAPRAAASMGSGEHILLAVLQGMMQMQQQQSAMMMGFLQSSKSDAMAIVQSSNAAAAAQSKMMADFYAKLAEVKNATPTDADTILKGMELGLDIAQKTAAPPERTDVQDLVEGMGAFLALQQSAKPTPSGDKPS